MLLALALVVLGVAMMVGGGMPLARDVDGRISELGTLLLFYLLVVGLMVTALGVLAFWLEVVS